MDPERYVADRETLAARLRDLRQAAGLTGMQAAASTGMSQPKISKLENGRLLPSVCAVSVAPIRLAKVRRGADDLGEQGCVAASATHGMGHMPPHHLSVTSPHDLAAGVLAHAAGQDSADGLADGAHALNKAAPSPATAACPSTARSTTDMISRFLGQRPMPGYEVFRAQLGLTVATLANTTDTDTVNRVFTQIVNEVITAGDGYAARAVPIVGRSRSYRVPRCYGAARRRRWDAPAVRGGSTTWPAGARDLPTGRMRTGNLAPRRRGPTATTVGRRLFPGHDVPVLVMCCWCVEEILVPIVGAAGYCSWECQDQAAHRPRREDDPPRGSGGRQLPGSGTATARGAAAPPGPAG